VQDNNLEGGLPPSIGVLDNLQRIDVANNMLTDAIPDTISECSELESINMQSNRIDGPLPPSIWRLQRLEYLYLTDNQVRGPLPEGLGYLAQIRELRLDHNLIDGTLPATIGDASTLQVMRIDNNLLSGSIPGTIGKLVNVENLDMHQNRLVGDIPAEISGMVSALKIHLQQNTLGGQMPESLGNLTSLQEFIVSRNTLSGTIPPSLGKLGSLVTLAIDSNSIGGAIPQQLGQLKRRIRTLHLQNNRLNGLLPTFFRQPEFRAVAINLGSNPFWCPLPAWPALNGTASCVHCPNDIFLEDDHRTCSDHGVCIDGVACRCDPAWEGETCNLLRCTGPEDGCNNHGDCENDHTPAPCVLSSGGNLTDAAEGLCTNLLDDCIVAYHDCPQKGASVQIDSTGIVIAEAPKHNQIVFAKCICRDAWSGNDCSMPPLPPPTIEPWPDPYEGLTSAAPSRCTAPWQAALALGVASAWLLLRS